MRATDGELNIFISAWIITFLKWSSYRERWDILAVECARCVMPNNQIAGYIYRCCSQIAGSWKLELEARSWLLGQSGPLKGIPKAYRKPIGAMVTGRGYGYRHGPEITRGYISIISGAKHDFLYQLFMLIPNFLSGRSYLSGNQCFIESSSKINEAWNLNSHGPSEHKNIFSFFHICLYKLYIIFIFLYLDL